MATVAGVATAVEAAGTGDPTVGTAVEAPMKAAVDVEVDTLRIRVNHDTIVVVEADITQAVTELMTHTKNLIDR